MTDDTDDHGPDGAASFGVLTRRRVLSAAAAVGVAGGAANLAGAQQARTVELEASVGGWVGVSPDAISGQTNPTLALEPGEDYTLTWTNGDGAPHNFTIEDADGNEIVSSEIVSEQGASQTVEFTASEEMAEYYCQVHPQSMRGQVATAAGGGTSQPTETPQETETPADGDGGPQVDLPREYHAHLSGDAHGVQTNAWGEARFMVDEDGTEARYEVTVRNICDVTQAHIHIGGEEESGPVVVWLYPEEDMEPRLVEGRFSGTLATGTITEDDLVGEWDGASFEDVLAVFEQEAAYVNVHTEAHPGGEIRGQIVPPHE